MFEKCVAFLYRTREEAEARDPAHGGTAFVMCRPVSAPDGKHLAHVPYLVSNRHVVQEGSACVALINSAGGAGAEVIEIDQEDWIPHPDGDDVAAVSLMPYVTKTLARDFICETHFITQEDVKSYDIGAGDDIFMIGRFVGLDKTSCVSPATRMGSISVSGSAIHIGGGKYQRGFAVEMRSRGGFSGAPVFVYRTETGLMPGRVSPEMEELGNQVGPVNTKHLLQLGITRFIGVSWGYIVLPNEHGEDRNTYMNGVIPAWKVSELLDQPILNEAYKQIADQVLGDGAPSI